jgi:hypothetical protein
MQMFTSPRKAMARCARLAKRLSACSLVGFDFGLGSVNAVQEQWEGN